VLLKLSVLEVSHPVGHQPEGEVQSGLRTEDLLNGIAQSGTNLHANLFEQFSSKGLVRLFPLFDMAAGEVPNPRVPLPARRAVAEEHSFITPENGRDHVVLVHSTSLTQDVRQPHAAVVPDAGVFSGVGGGGRPCRRRWGRRCR